MTRSTLYLQGLTLDLINVTNHEGDALTARVLTYGLDLQATCEQLGQGARGTLVVANAVADTLVHSAAVIVTGANVVLVDDGATVRFTITMRAYRGYNL